MAPATSTAGVQRTAPGVAEGPVFLADCRQRACPAQCQWQRIGIDLTHGTEPVIGSPRQRLHQFGIQQRTGIGQTQRLFQAVTGNSGLGIDRHDHADQLATTERHHDTRPHAGRAAGRRQIVERVRQGYWQGNAQDDRHAYLVIGQCTRRCFLAVAGIFAAPYRRRAPAV